MNTIARPKVLIVDDESSVREFLGEVLSASYQTVFARSGAEALVAAETQNPELIILDVIMPGMSGLEVCKSLRDNPVTRRIPVFMLTALGDVNQKIEAFKNGADDYILKPFNASELAARVERKFQRIKETNATHSTAQHGKLSLDFENFKVKIGGKVIELGHVEFKIFNCLAKTQGSLVTREALNTYVWGEDLPSDRALDPHITGLRKKLTGSSGELKTVYGKGYSLLLRD